MSRAVMLSTGPKWCEKIASGDKTIEVRKTRPKLEPPFKCYIYCTGGREYLYKDGNDIDTSRKNEFELTIFNSHRILNQKIIGEFMCERIDTYSAEFVGDGEGCYECVRYYYTSNGEISDDIPSRIITSNECNDPNDCDLLRKSGLCFDQLRTYVGVNFHDKPFFGWHISNLIIYDKPKELSDFCSPPEMYCEKELCGGCPKDQVMGLDGDYAFDCEWKRPLKRPPQSWCYVEELEN